MSITLHKRFSFLGILASKLKIGNLGGEAGQIPALMMSSQLHSPLKITTTPVIQLHNLITDFCRDTKSTKAPVIPVFELTLPAPSTLTLSYFQKS